MALPSLSKLDPIKAVSRQLPSLSQLNPIRGVGNSVPPQLFSLFAILGSIVENKKNDNQTKETTKKVVKQIIQQAKSTPVSSTISTGTPIRQGYLSAGQTFAKDGKIITVPDGYLYNVASGRLVTQNEMGTLPFASFASAGINLTLSVFQTYQNELFKRLDKITENISKINLNITYGEDIIEKSEKERSEEEKEGTGSSFLAGIASQLLEFLQFAIRKIIKMLREAVRKIVNKLKDAVKKFIEKIKDLINKIKEKFKKVLDFVKRVVNKIKNIVKKIYDKIKKAVEKLVKLGVTAVKSLTGKIKPFVGKITGKLGGLLKFFNKLRFATRAIPGIGVLISALFEGIEADDKLNQIAEKKASGELTEEEYRQQSTEVVAQAVLNTLGSTLGAGAGGILGSILGPVGTIGGAMIGAYLGKELAELIGPSISPIIASAINDTNADKLVKNVTDFLFKVIPDFISSIPERIKKMTGIANDIKNQALNAFANSKEWFANQFGTGWNFIKDTASSISNYFGGGDNNVGIASEFGGTIPYENPSPPSSSPSSSNSIVEKSNVVSVGSPISGSKISEEPEIAAQKNIVNVDNSSKNVVLNTNFIIPNRSGYDYPENLAHAY